MSATHIDERLNQVHAKINEIIPGTPLDYSRVILRKNPGLSIEKVVDKLMACYDPLSGEFELEESSKEEQSTPKPEVESQSTKPSKPEKKVSPIKKQYSELEQISQRVLEINKTYALVEQGKKSMIVKESVDPITGQKECIFQELGTFIARFLPEVFYYQNRQYSLGEIWLRHPRRRFYDKVDFLPGIVADDIYNIWSGFAVKPKENEQAFLPLKNHIKEIICDGRQDIYDYVMDWCAHAVQQPGILPGVALVLRSRQGTGKNAFVEALGRIFGVHFITVVQGEQLYGRFTGHLRKAVMVFVNEAVWDGTRDGRGKLKGMITDDKLSIEAKGKDAIMARNFKRFIFASNETMAVPLEADDRRFVCLNVSPKKIGDLKYFAELWAAINGPDLIPAFMHELSTRNISKFNPYLKPTNGDGDDIKIGNLPVVEKWWLHCLETGKCVERTDITGRLIRDSEGSIKKEWPLRVSKERLYDSFVAWAKAGHRAKRIPEHHRFGRDFMRLTKEEGSKNVRVTVSGEQKAAYLIPDVHAAREIFKEVMKLEGYKFQPLNETEILTQDELEVLTVLKNDVPNDEMLEGNPLGTDRTKTSVFVGEESKEVLKSLIKKGYLSPIKDDMTTILIWD